MYLKLITLTAAFVLIGAGCNLTPAPEESDLPTTPPSDSGAMMLPEVDDEVLVDDASDEMMVDEDSENDGMMKDDDGMMDEVDEDSDEFGDSGMERLDTDDDGDGIKTENEAMMTAKKPYYIAYTSDVAEAAMREGRPVVYYFWAAWCPICKAEEPTIKNWVETSEHPVAGFRVNYDTESALKSKYKVPYQHTTVFLNASGVEVERFNGPVTESEFRAALALAAR